MNTAELAGAASTAEPISGAACWPWCSWRDDHPFDEACYGPEVFVDLSAYPEIDDHMSSEGYRRGPDQLNVHGYAAAAGGVPRILMAHNVQPGLGFFQVELTPAEARELCENLQLVLGQIGAGR